MRSSGDRAPDGLVEFVDVAGSAPDELYTGRPSRRLPLVLTAVALALGVMATVQHARDHARTAPSSTVHLALERVAGFAVSGVVTMPEAEVLLVDYTPTRDARYAGGRVTLYADGGFDAAGFTPHAMRVVVAGHRAYVGSYEYLRSVAWPLSGGRWVCVNGFGEGGPLTAPARVRAIELAVATHVRVH